MAKSHNTNPNRSHSPNHGQNNGTRTPTKKVDELLSKATSIVPKRIEFHKARRPDVHAEILRVKYQPINGSNAEQKNIPQKKVGGQGLKEDDLNQPVYELFHEEQIAKFLKWDQVRRIGAGLQNLGNTCFLNSVLQCLSYTPPFANYCLQKQHSKNCHANGFCMFCQMEQHVNRALSADTSAIAPQNIVKNLKFISKMFRLGRQEDSHEFIRYVVEGMQQSCLNGLDKKLDPRIQETTVVHRIFGGYLQSSVECSDCKFKSNTFDPFLDLSLEIKGCDSLEKAFQHFTRPEILDKANKYKCTNCSKLVQAKKQFTIKSAPNVLTVQLKRFSFTGFFGGKISKHVAFPDKLDLSPYMSNPAKDRPTYQLYGVLVHQGGSTHSGHYFSFVKSSGGFWYCMDDSRVQQMSAQAVFSQNAYMLFYVRDSARQTAKNDQVIAANTVVTPMQTPIQSKKIDTPKKEVANPTTQKNTPNKVNDKRKMDEPAIIQTPKKTKSNGEVKPMLDNEVPSISGLFAPKSPVATTTPSTPSKDTPSKKRKMEEVEADARRDSCGNVWTVVDADSVTPKKQKINALCSPRSKLVITPIKVKQHMEVHTGGEVPKNRPTTSLRDSSPEEIEGSGESDDYDTSPPVQAQHFTKPSPRAAVVVWDQQKQNNGTASPQNRQKQAELLTTLMSSQSSQFSTEVGTWDEVESKSQKLAFQQSILKELEPKQKERDEWDVELDKGKVKKVKAREFIDPDAPNIFQGFVNSNGKQKLLNKLRRPKKKGNKDAESTGFE